MVLGHPPLAVGAAPPKVLGRVHSRYKTPHVSTIVIGAVATVWYVVFNLVSQNFLFDSLTALAIVIAFYYALTGFSCAIYYRHELRKSFKNLLFIGIAPVTGALILTGLFFKAVYEFAQVDGSYTGQAVFGVAIPAVLGVGLLLSGIVLMIVWRLRGNETFFGRATEVVEPDVAAGRRSGTAAVPESSA